MKQSAKEKCGTSFYIRLTYAFVFRSVLNVRRVCKRTVHMIEEENNLKPCSTKQLEHVFKVWCEWGIRVSASP